MALQPRWLLLAVLAAVLAGIAVGLWVYAAVAG